MEFVVDWPCSSISGFAMQPGENFISRMGRRIFVTICHTSSYATAVAVSSSAIGGLLSIIFILNVWPYVTVKFSEHFILALQLVLLFPWVKSLFLFGAFRRLGHLGSFRVMKIVNQYLVVRERQVTVVENAQPGDYKKILYSLTRLPRLLFLNAIADILVSVAVLIPIALYLSVDRIFFLWLPLMAAITVATYAGLSFVLAEAATGNMRKHVLHYLHHNKIKYIEETGVTIRIKQILFHGFLVSALLLTNILTYINSENLYTALILSGVTALAMILMANTSFTIIFDSLKGIGKAVNDLKSGKRGLIHSKSLDREFVNLAHGINAASDTIHDYRANLEQKVENRTRELEKSNKELRKALHKIEQKDLIFEQELELAAEIQRGIIQEDLSPWDGLHFAATYLPMGKVSGDYYDIFRHMSSVHVLLADVSGHGVPAALITMAAKEAFSVAVGDGTPSPAEIFSRVNTELCKRVKTQDYLTAYMLKINNDNYVTYCNAAHQHAIYYNRAEETFTLLDTEGLFIGAMPEASNSYSEKRFKLNAGDRIFLYTDGLIDSVNEKNEDFSVKRLVAFLEECKNKSLNEIHNQLIVKFNQFVGKALIRDDISMISLELDPKWTEFEKLFNEGQRLAKEQQLYPAQHKLSRAFDLIPTVPSLVMQLAEVSRQLKEYKEAAKFIEMYIRKYDGKHAHYKLATEIFLEMNEIAKAKFHLSRLIDITPSSNKEKTLEVNQLKELVAAAETN